MVNSVRLGLLGCGVVGGGVIETIWNNQEHIASNHSLRFDIIRVAVRNSDLDRTEHTNKETLCSDWRLISYANDIDVVVEAMGGVTPAYDAVKGALESGKHVVTANKELLALHGDELHTLAARFGVKLLCEASALGGIPALHTLTGYFQGNQITSFVGIVNGTSNYILTQMSQEKQSFFTALEDAQEKGYAEANPSSDVEGWDALYKLKILVRHALKIEFDIANTKRIGISNVTPVDIEVASALDCKIKHVVIAKFIPAETRLEVSVSPVFVSKAHPLYGTDGVNNALLISASSFGDYLIVGPGAGRFPTGGAIIEDLISLYSNRGGKFVPTKVVPTHPVQHPSYILFESDEHSQTEHAMWGHLVSELQTCGSIVYHPEHTHSNIRAITVQLNLSSKAKSLEVIQSYTDYGVSCYPFYDAHIYEERLSS